MKYPAVTLGLSVLLTVAAFGQPTMPDTYTALQPRLENQPDSVRMDRLADFVWAKIDRGNFTEATAASQGMMSVAERTGNPLFLGRAYIAAGHIAQNEGNPGLNSEESEGSTFVIALPS